MEQQPRARLLESKPARSRWQGLTALYEIARTRRLPSTPRMILVGNGRRARIASLSRQPILWCGVDAPAAYRIFISRQKDERGIFTFPVEWSQRCKLYRRHGCGTLQEEGPSPPSSSGVYELATHFILGHPWKQRSDIRHHPGRSSMQFSSRWACLYLERATRFLDGWLRMCNVHRRR